MAISLPQTRFGTHAPPLSVVRGQHKYSIFRSGFNHTVADRGTRRQPSIERYISKRPLSLLICEAKSAPAKHERSSFCTRFLDRSNLIDLDEVTARIIEYGHGCHSHVCWFHSELHAQLFQSGILFLNVVNLKCRERYPVRQQGLFKCLSVNCHVAQNMRTRELHQG